MKKVLIISYFFPPCNFVAAERTSAWAKHLSQFGYYPIIITRRWNNEQQELTDNIIDNTFFHEKHPSHEVYRLPYKRTFRDVLSDYPLLYQFRKGLTFLELFFSNYFIWALPFSNFYPFAKKLLSKDPSIHFLISSGSPFQSFFIGYKLKKRYNKLIWISDYRDEWTTRTTSHPKSFLERFLFKLNKKSEILWTSNINLFLTVSEPCKTTINNLIQKNGFIIKNGYNINNTISNVKASFKEAKLNFIYIGTLYPYQNIELFIKAINRLSPTLQQKIKVSFLGIEMIPGEKERLLNLIKGSEDIFEIYSKKRKEELVPFLNNADIALATAYRDLKGCLPVKIFDYYSFGLPILLCPSDNDEIENFIKATKSGYIINTEEECIKLLEELINKRIAGHEFKIKRDPVETIKYSREYQTKLLAKVLDDY